MEKIVFKDSRAIKITAEMRKALDSYNQKKDELEKANEEITSLENSRKQKENELNNLNIALPDSDKKNIKENNKKIKNIDKEINKIQNDIQKTNDKINKLLEKSKPVNVPDVVLKSFKTFGTTETNNQDESIANINNKIDEQIIMPEPKIENDLKTPQESINEEDSSEKTIFDATPSINLPNIDETPEEENLPSIEPVELENPKTDNIEVVDETKEEIESSEDNEEDDQEIYNPFLSTDEVDKMWNQMTDENEPIAEPIEESEIVEKIEEPIDEPVEKKEDKKNNEKQFKEIPVDEIPGIEKPNIFGKNSEFAKIADKNVSPKPLIPESSDTSLVCYEDYNDYKFKFGQKHYGKEALTPKELSDLSTINEFLDNDDFEIQRSNQYIDIKNENAELKERITNLNNDYKQQISDMKQEHNSNLQELEKLIDKANDIINANKERIKNLENIERDLNNTINKQTSEIESLNKKQKELEDTIDKLNENIANLENTRDQQETKIQNYEGKFKEVLGIVREVKIDN